jgi:hypothetical protein
VRPAEGAPSAEREEPPTAIHLPPLSSPRGGPPRESSGPKAARHRCMCPSGGGSPSPSHARRRLLVRVCPRRSGGTVAIGQPSTDPEMCPPIRGRTGLLLLLQAQGRAARSDLAQCRCADQSERGLPLRRKRGGLLGHQRVGGRAQKRAQAAGECRQPLNYTQGHRTVAANSIRGLVLDSPSPLIYPPTLLVPESSVSGYMCRKSFRRPAFLVRKKVDMRSTI